MQVLNYSGRQISSFALIYIYIYIYIYTYIYVYKEKCPPLLSAGSEDPLVDVCKEATNAYVQSATNLAMMHVKRLLMHV